LTPHARRADIYAAARHMDAAGRRDARATMPVRLAPPRRAAIERAAAVMNAPAESQRPAEKPVDDPPPRASLLQIFGAVFWSFFGVRKRAAMQRDLSSIRPHQVIIVAVVCAALFVATLLTIVHFIAGR
jgi:hypothetical protein